jgi:hypothetical protein
LQHSQNGLGRRLMSPISSKMVPLSAASNLPARSFTAELNAFNVTDNRFQSVHLELQHN